MQGERWMDLLLQWQPSKRSSRRQLSSGSWATSAKRASPLNHSHSHSLWAAGGGRLAVGAELLDNRCRHGSLTTTF